MLVFSQLHTQPTYTSVYASLTPLRLLRARLEAERIANPFS